MCTQVLHYMLSQPHLVVKSWRARIYNFSSGTLIKIASEQLQDWIQVIPSRCPARIKYLEKLVDKDDLYKYLGDAIMKFIELKPQPFPTALYSKKHFFRYPAWKRAMVGLHMVRVVLNQPASKQWNMYNVGDYKFNVRFFRFWLKKDKAIMEKSAKFQALLDDCQSPPSRKRKRPVASPSVSSASEATPCMVFNVNDSSSGGDDSDSGDDKEWVCET